MSENPHTPSEGADPAKLRQSSTLANLAARHSLSIQTIRRQINRGEGPRVTYFGRAARVTLADEMEWISRLRNPTGDLASRAETRRDHAYAAAAARWDRERGRRS